MDTPFVKRAYNLGLKAVPNFVEALGEEEISYYEQHLDQLPAAISRGFVLPSPKVQPAPQAITAPLVVFGAVDTDLNFWLAKAEEFAKKYLGVEIDLRKHFAIPAELPWKSVIPIFNPRLTNRDAVQKALKDSGLTVWEEVDVMKYSGSEASKQPTLHFIQNSIRPDADTMNMSPDQLVATKKNWLDLRGYALAFGLYHFASDQYLDPETFTWLPNNRLTDDGVARGSWYPGSRGVGFHWFRSRYRDGYGGSRLAIPVPLLP